MKIKSKKFKTLRAAKKYASVLKKDGQLNVQIWELPTSTNRNIYQIRCTIVWTHSKLIALLQFQVYRTVQK